MLRLLRGRRRPRYGAHICAVIAALLLLLSVSLLHSRLISSPNTEPKHPQFDYFNDPNVLDDLFDSDPITNRDGEDRIDELDDAVLESNNNDEVLPEDEDEESSIQNQNPSLTSNYYFDHVAGVVRRSFNRRSIEEWEDYVPFNAKLASDLGFKGNDDESKKVVFGSDDILVDEKLREKLSKVRKFEDVLLLKGSALREDWGKWFEKKADFLRRDRMFKSNVEVLNPLSNPMLQDPDGVGLTMLTRGDKEVSKGLLSEFTRTPFLVKKPLAVVEAKKENQQIEKSGGVERKPLDIRDKARRGGATLEKEYYADGKRWGYYPLLDDKLSFSNFMNSFFRRGRCKLRVFMVWNSPPWMFGVRHQRVLESLLYHNKDACVVVFSETIELNFFTRYVKDCYKVAVAMPNLDELLKDTPTHIFASVWHEWKKTTHYPTHYSELIRLASLYKYGGIYLDSDVLVLKPLSELDNSVGIENNHAEKTLNGAVMAFRKHSPFIMECLKEFYASYDDTKLRWNGADLLTRVANNFSSNTEQPASIFFPISQNMIARYFVAPETEIEKHEQDVLFDKILNESVTVHLWNSLTSALIPEPDSLVFRLLNKYCIHCSDDL